MDAGLKLQKGGWTALAILAFGGASVRLVAQGELYVLASLFLDYVKKYGV